MYLSELFHVCSAAVIPGWLLLMFLPGWKWTQRITTFFLIVPLAALYLGLFLAYWNSHLGVGSLDQVYAIFQNPAMVLAGWIHYLAFDLFVGSWEARDARERGVPHLALVPCLLLTCLFGPAGWLLYLLARRVPGDRARG